MALRKRIGLFESVVGRLQPILASVPRLIAQKVFDPKASDPERRSAAIGELEKRAEEAKKSGFDLDEVLIVQKSMNQRGRNPN